MNKHILISAGWNNFKKDMQIKTDVGPAQITHVGKKCLFLKFQNKISLSNNDQITLDNITFNVYHVSGKKAKLKPSYV